MTAVLVTCPDPGTVVVGVDSLITRGWACHLAKKAEVVGSWVVTFCGAQGAHVWATQSPEAVAILNGHGDLSAIVWALADAYAAWAGGKEDRRANIIVARDGRAWQFSDDGAPHEITSATAFGDPTAPVAAYHAYRLAMRPEVPDEATAVRGALESCARGSHMIGGPMTVYIVRDGEPPERVFA